MVPEVPGAPTVATKTRKPAPTQAQYAAYQGAYDYFNRVLFDGELPHAMLGFQRRPNSVGYIIGDKWINGAGERIAEITLNPDHLHGRPLDDTLSTLVHEMVHLWDMVLGSNPRQCYHPKSWARKMESLGLMPTDTGKPGGKKTGQRMTHYILPGGPFADAFRAMPAEVSLPWFAIPEGDDSKKKSKPKRVKYTCPVCATKAYAVPGAKLICGEDDCELAMMEPDDANDGDSDGDGED